MTTPARKMYGNTIHVVPDDYEPSSPAICGFAGAWKAGPWLHYGRGTISAKAAMSHPSACPKCAKLVA